jgi:hypothetical protein
MDADACYSHNGRHSRTEPRDISIAREPAESFSREMVTPSDEAVAEPSDTTEVLAYLKSTFENPTMLDKLPLEAAANPGAWHAWRSHRGISKGPSRAISPANGERSQPPVAGFQTSPGDWNWEGVWEKRVRTGIENSLSDPVLFAPKGGRGGEKRTEMVSRTRQ